MLPPDVHHQIEKLGRVFLKFYQAANQLYYQSVAGKQPSWIAELLDAGKPDWLITLQHQHVFKNELPAVIRPDLLWTENGLALTELDSVPGGIGILSCLQHLYLGEETMLEGFRSIFGEAPTVRIVVSQESAFYRPEMEYLARRLGTERFKVVDVNSIDFPDGCVVYRFFELFDLANIPCAQTLSAKALRKQIILTPPPKPVLEEKSMLALLWNHTLRNYWYRELGSGFFTQMQALVPRSWVMDPTPLPPHAEYPGLNIQDWNELKEFIQSKRKLVLKVSDFSELAWGSRGVWIGSDLSREDWAQAVEQALTEFHSSPRILMQFAHSRTVPGSWYDFQTDRVQEISTRICLCPYYIVQGSGTQRRASYCGTLATLCPIDKKIIHGITDAILCPIIDTKSI